MTKASVSVAATAIAKISSGGEEPLTTSFLTSIGCASRSISGPATSRLSRAWLAKLVTSRSEVRSGPRRQRRFQRGEDLGGGAEAEDVGALADHRSSPPSISRSR